MCDEGFARARAQSGETAMVVIRPKPSLLVQAPGRFRRDLVVVDVVNEQISEQGEAFLVGLQREADTDHVRDYFSLAKKCRNRWLRLGTCPIPHMTTSDPSSRGSPSMVVPQPLERAQRAPSGG